jgi:hypothetical protein
MVAARRTSSGVKFAARKNWQLSLGVVWLAIGLLACLICVLADVLQPPPAFEDLKPRPSTLSGALAVHLPHKGTPWVSVPVDHLCGRIKDPCFLWAQCNLPAGASALKAGDKLTLWLQDDRIWQMASGDSILLSYAQVLQAHRKATLRLYQLCGGFTSVSLLLALLGYWRRWAWRRDVI